MAPGLSSLELPALVEHMQTALRHVRLRLTDPGPLAPGDRVCAADHIKQLAATLGNLRQLIVRSETSHTSSKECGDHGDP